MQKQTKPPDACYVLNVDFKEIEISYLSALDLEGTREIAKNTNKYRNQIPDLDNNEASLRFGTLTKTMPPVSCCYADPPNPK